MYGGNLFDIRKASPLEDAYGLQMSLDGEYITVKGVTTTTRYGNVSFRILGYPVNLYGNRFSMDIVKNVGTSKEYVYTSATENTLALSVVVDAKAAVELKFRLMVNAGSTALPYEPYKPAQTLIIPTPNGLPGIPVTFDGNYTDADGQQWVCDEVDFKKGVYVQRVAKEIPNTSLGVRETPDVKGRYSFTKAFKNIYKNGDYKCLISHGIYGRWGTKKDTWAMVGTAFVYSPEERTTEDKLKEKILSLINSDNPLTFLGQLETAIEKPLTTEQLAKYKALRTYSPTTTVINDAGAGMSVGYAKMK